MWQNLISYEKYLSIQFDINTKGCIMIAKLCFLYFLFILVF
jgi:hypothetical protein